MRDSKARQDKDKSAAIRMATRGLMVDPDSIIRELAPLLRIVAELIPKLRPVMPLMEMIGMLNTGLLLARHRVVRRRYSLKFATGLLHLLREVDGMSLRRGQGHRSRIRNCLGCGSDFLDGVGCFGCVMKNMDELVEHLPPLPDIDYEEKEDPMDDVWRRLGLTS